jgi:uncharacterized protein (DUF362 family)
MSQVAKVWFKDYTSSVFKALDLVKAYEKLPGRGTIILKPNLTNSSPPPVTTPVEAVEAVYLYCKKYSHARIIIGEGCGSGITPDVYKANGYTKIAEKYGIPLVDFNTAPAVTLARDDTFVLKEFHMPAIAEDAFIISIPVLKDHLFTKTTVAMKNMFGLAPAPFYANGWNKSRLHSPSTDKAVVDICLYKKPGLCLVDAVAVLTGSHLSGCRKKMGIILAGFDCVAVDAAGSRLLGHNPAKLEYLQLAYDLLGDMNNIEMIEG